MNNSARNLILLLLIFLLIESNKAYGQFGEASDLSVRSRSSIGKLEERIDSISSTLMIAVYDTSYSEGERLEFVVLLGEIGTEKCIDFLIKNLNYRIYTGPMGETGMAQAQIFLVVLSEVVKNKWSIIQSIRKALQSEIVFDKKTLINLGLVLTSSCNKNVDMAIIILKNTYNGKYSTKQNIDEMLFLFSGR